MNDRSLRSAEITASLEAFLSLRLCETRKDLSQQPLTTANFFQAVTALATDILRASGATKLTIDNGVFSATFVDLAAATAVARRIQWAIQGLAEYSGSPAPAAAIFIDLPAISADPDSPSQRNAGCPTESIDPVAPGQIMLTPIAWHKLENIPVLPLHPASERESQDGLRELLWRAPYSETTPEADYQFLAGLAQKHGLADHFPADHFPADHFPADHFPSHLDPIQRRVATQAPAPTSPITSSKNPLSSTLSSPPATQSTAPVSGPHDLERIEPKPVNAHQNDLDRQEHQSVIRGSDPNAGPLNEPARSSTHDTVAQLHSRASFPSAEAFEPSLPEPDPILLRNESLSSRSFSTFDPPSDPSAKTKWIPIAAVAATLLLAAIGFLVWRHEAASAPVAQSHQPLPADPGSVSPKQHEPAKPSADQHPQRPVDPASKPTKTLPPVSGTSPVPKPPVEGKPSTSKCSLNPSQYSVALDGAWSLYQRRDYSLAKTGFLSVLACDRSNRSAADGLSRVAASDRHPEPGESDQP